MHLWTSQSTLIRKQVWWMHSILFPWLPWHLLCRWMDREIFPHWMLAFAHDAFPSWHFLANWSDEYCSIGSTRPAQHDTTASVHLTDGPLSIADLDGNWCKQRLHRQPCGLLSLLLNVFTPQPVFRVHLGLDCKLLLYLSPGSLWWLSLICAVFSHQTECVCFPSPQIKRCLKGLSVAFSCKDDTSKDGLMSQ